MIAPSPESTTPAPASILCPEAPARRYGCISQPDFDVEAAMADLHWAIWSRAMQWPTDLLPLLTEKLKDFGKFVERERSL